MIVYARQFNIFIEIGVYFMHNGYYTVADVVELNSTQINKYNPEIAKDLLSGVTSPMDLVRKI